MNIQDSVILVLIVLALMFKVAKKKNIQNQLDQAQELSIQHHLQSDKQLLLKVQTLLLELEEVVWYIFHLLMFKLQEMLTHHQLIHQKLLLKIQWNWKNKRKLKKKSPHQKKELKKKKKLKKKIQKNLKRYKKKKLNQKHKVKLLKNYKPKQVNQLSHLKLIKESHGIIELPLIVLEQLQLKLFSNNNKLNQQTYLPMLRVLQKLPIKQPHLNLKTKETEKVLNKTTGMNTG